jgi:glycosyltransferase involved in cell wall biosynthesis
MKIAYVYDVIYPYVKGGAEKSFWELAKRLSTEGHQVHLFGMKSWEGKAHFVKEGVHIHGVGRARKLYLKSGIRSTSQVLCFSLSILAALRKEKFDIIDCNAFPYLPYFMVKLHAFLSKTPLVITWQEVWDKYWYNYLGRVRGFIGRIIERIVIGSSQYIIAHSQKTRDALYACGFRGKEVRVILHGIDLVAMESIACAKDNTDLLFVGRLIKDKNVDMLIRALALVKKELPDINCLIIGEGPEKERLITLREELGLEDNIVFKGFLEYEQVIAHMKASKVFIFPSTREGFGIVVMEAMAAGLPVITVEHPMNSATELIKEGVNGYLSSPTAEELASRVISLFKNKDMIKRLSGLAKESTRNYDWKKIAEISEEFYKEVITGR